MELEKRLYALQTKSASVFREQGIEYGCNLGLMFEENGEYLSKQQE